MKENDAPEINRLEYMGGIFFFISFVVAYLIANANVAVKVLGTATICVGIVWFFRRRVAFGVEARAPSGEIRGYGARVAGIVAIVVGTLLFAYSTQVACSVGWAEERECH
jgi:hypothetical protein